MEKVKFLELQDGRQISFREQGLDKQHATRNLLVLHGLGSSRIASMPGATADSFSCLNWILSHKGIRRSLWILWFVYLWLLTTLRGVSLYLVACT
jgi:hypothetical protein